MLLSGARYLTERQKGCRRPHRFASRLRLTFALALAALAIGDRPAAADSDFRARLSYDVGASLPGCWDGNDFRKKVTHRLGYDPFSDDAPTVVSVRVDGAASAIGGNVFWQDAKGATLGERRFVARDGNCAKLLAEMAFAVALQIQMLGLSPAVVVDHTDAEVGNGSQAPAPAESQPQPPSIERRPPVTEPPPEEPEPPAPMTMWLGLGPQLAYGTAPSLVPQGRIFFGLRHRKLSYEAGFEMNVPTTYDRWGGSGFRELLFAGSLAVCGHEGAAAGCLLGKLGELETTGTGLDVKRSPSAVVAHAGARLGATIGISTSWFVALHVDGMVLLTPCTVGIAGNRIWTMPRLAAFAGLDIAARFW